MDPIALIALALLLVGGLIGSLAVRQGVVSSRGEALARLAEALRGGQVTSGLFGGQVEGRLPGGRRVWFRQAGDAQTLAVEAPGAADLKLSAMTGLNELARWLGLRSSADGPGQRLNVLSGRSEAARLYQHEASRLLLLSLLEEQNGAVIRLRDGWLSLSRTSADLGLERFQADLRRLVALATLCERAPVARPPEGLARAFAWTGGGGTPRCPYCRDDLERPREDPAEEPAGCHACGTLHHAGCLAEAGGCTVFGCRGRRVEAARVR